MDKVVKVYGSWCRPCWNFAPVFEQADVLTNVPFEIMDIDFADKEWLRSLGVTSIPAVLFYRDGEVVDILKGSDTTEGEILDKIGELYD